MLNYTTLKGLAGLMLVAFSVTGICMLSVFISEDTAQYDCYVWGFNNAKCRYDRAGESAPVNPRCVEHLKPVPDCEGLPETIKGMAEAMQVISSHSEVSLPDDRDYRSFHVQY